jgi:hypothetical protein
VLGVGGRLAMRGVALAGGSPAVFTAEGTITVLLAGTASGAGGGLLLAMIERWVPAPRWPRRALFLVACLLVALRGLHPVTATSAALFVPLVVIYAVALGAAWERRRPPIFAAEGPVAVGDPRGRDGGSK